MVDTNVFDITVQDKYKELMDFKKNNPSFDMGTADTPESYQEALEKMEKFKAEENGNEEEKTPAPEKENEQNDETLNINSNLEDEPQDENSEWIEESKKYWQEWCADPSRKYEYVQDDIKSGHAFDIYKSEADKKAGKKYGHIHYQSKTSVHVESDSYEVWKGVIEKAIKDGQGLSVSGMDPKTDEKAIKMVMIAATIAGAKDKLVGVPDGMKVTVEDMKAFGIANFHAKYEEMLGGDNQPIEKSAPKDWEKKSINLPKERIAQIREAQEKLKSIRGKTNNGIDLSDEEKSFLEKAEKAEESRQPHVDNQHKSKDLVKLSNDATKTDAEREKAKSDRKPITEELKAFAKKSMEK